MSALSNDADDLLTAARALRGVNLDDGRWPWDCRERVLRVVGIHDLDPRALARFTRVEALVLDVIGLAPPVLAVLAGLPRLRALEVRSSQWALVNAPAGFPSLESLSLPGVDGGLERFARLFGSLPALRALHLPDAEAQTVPDVIPRLPALRMLDLSGVPIPDAALAELRRARPELELRTTRVNLGWRPGIAGVLRAPEAPLVVADIPPTARWETGFEMSVRARQVTLTVRWRETPADAPDYQEDVHGPVDVETFIAQGPPIALRPWDRAMLRRKLEGESPAG
jgi:hypothetical protein